jgi:hypothetical protein
VLEGASWEGEEGWGGCSLSIERGSCENSHQHAPAKRDQADFPVWEHRELPVGLLQTSQVKPPPSDGIGAGFSDFASTLVPVSQAPLGQLGVRKTLKRRRNGNWSDE